MAKFPYLTKRRGSQNWCYKRDVAPELRADGRPTQIWRSLKTADFKAAQKSYAVVHAEVEILLGQWRQQQRADPGEPSFRGASAASAECVVVPLTPALLKRLADVHSRRVQEQDFSWRGDLWKQVEQDEDAFWRGDIIERPADVCYLDGQPLSYFDHLVDVAGLKEVFLYCAYKSRENRLQQLRKLYQLGDTRSSTAAAECLLESQSVRLTRPDLNRLLRKLMEVEIEVLSDLLASDGLHFDGALGSEAVTESAELPTSASTPGTKASRMVERYLDEKARERDWPVKTVLRKRGELREFIEIVDDKPINAYTQADGIKFKDTQLDLPARRQKPPYKGLSLKKAAEKARQVRDSGREIELLNPITINDKIGTVSLFFDWAKQRDPTVISPVANLKIDRPRGRRKKKRHPWTIQELNRMFKAPIYTGCRSERFWSQSGKQILNTTATYWVPLLALFSGLRLGEIIQMQVADVKCEEGIWYFDVTAYSANIEDLDDEGRAEDTTKSLKTATSERGVPIHQTLMQLGFGAFLEFRRKSGETRLFPEFARAKDDASWSKQFSKHFRRFRLSIGVTRDGVDFHSLRHNVEDALRNADVRKEVRDAIQGHGENGVSREYGTGYYLKTLNEAVQKMTYEGLDLAPARAASSPSAKKRMSMLNGEGPSSTSATL